MVKGWNAREGVIMKDKVVAILLNFEMKNGHFKRIVSQFVFFIVFQ